MSSSLLDNSQTCPSKGVIWRSPRKRLTAEGLRAGSRRADRPKTLVLVAKRWMNTRGEFVRIRRYLREIAPELSVKVVADRPYHFFRPSFWIHPVMVFSPVRLRRLLSLRGRVFQGRRLSKSQECWALDSCGIPVPRWAVLTAEGQPDLTGFGKYVVSKPDWGDRGAEVKIRRASRIRWGGCDSTHEGRCVDKLLIQRFIYTGPWPSSYRVTTLFGKALWSWKVEADQARRPLLGPDRFADGATGGGMSIVSTGKGCTFRLNDEPDVLELAERAHAAFPNVPLLGIDIIREHPSGKLYVIEANSCGRAWHINSPTGRAIQDQFGFELESQFDGIRKAAAILAEQTRRFAA
jgi:hypothetical protein